MFVKSAGGGGSRDPSRYVGIKLRRAVPNAIAASICYLIVFLKLYIFVEELRHANESM